MNRLHLAVVIAFLVALAVPLTASAQGSIEYNSGIQIQNLDASNAAAIQIKFYNQDGSVEATVDDTIAADDSNTYFPLTAVAEGFFGSVVVASDREVRGITNVLGNGLAYGAAYSGFGAGTEEALPLLMKENAGFTSWYSVQNAGTAATDVSIEYSDGLTASCTDLAPGAACTVDQGDEAHAPGWIGSAVVTSDEPIAVTVMEVGATTLFGYSGFTGGSVDVAMPLINANNSGFITGVQIQNFGDTATQVTVSYTPSTAGTACYETQTIPANDSATFALQAFASGANGDCVAGETFIGSAEVTANSTSQELVAIVNQLNLDTNKGAAYEAFDPSAATNAVVMPLIMDRNSDYWTGFSVSNVGSASTTVNCTFTGTSYTASDTIGAGEAMTLLQYGAIADGYVGSATCTAGAGAQIVGVVNELNTELEGDTLLVYKAFNK
jgi:hypothetical protein